MPAAIIVSTIGVMLVYSALTGRSILDVFGETGDSQLDDKISRGEGASVGTVIGDALSGGKTGDIGPNWTPKSIIDRIVIPMARSHHMVTGTSAALVAAANAAHGPTVDGNQSDHQGPPDEAWADDMSNGGKPTPEMDALARDLAKAFGMVWTGSGLVNKTEGGFRYQLIYRTNEGGNHYNHVHFGVRKV